MMPYIRFTIQLLLAVTATIACGVLWIAFAAVSIHLLPVFIFFGLYFLSSELHIYKQTRCGFCTETATNSCANCRVLLCQTDSYESGAAELPHTYVCCECDAEMREYEKQQPPAVRESPSRYNLRSRKKESDDKNKSYAVES